MRIVETKGSIKEWVKVLRGLHEPSWHTTQELETVLDAMYMQTQENVHVITGKLKASGLTSSNYRRGRWSGTISYGGEGTSAPYAVYEVARDGVRPDWPHKPHDPFVGLEEKFSHAVEDAIDSHFKDL